ncbi:uncharacterized protein BKA78DRAFT_71155 [Phyllosticta capitalensis]|uniref:uncharacterized protein n=1 Tax=Phyllosticta capitalensis TaxID=121624 RepID=UPI00312CF829
MVSTWVTKKRSKVFTRSASLGQETAHGPRDTSSTRARRSHLRHPHPSLCRRFQPARHHRYLLPDSAVALGIRLEIDSTLTRGWTFPRVHWETSPAPWVPFSSDFSNRHILGQLPKPTLCISRRLQNITAVGDVGGAEDVADEAKSTYKSPSFHVVLSVSFGPWS